MGAGMCKDIVPGAGVGGEGRGGTIAASGGCRDTVDRAMERILHRKTQVIHDSNMSSRPTINNGTHLTSSSSPTFFKFPDQPKRPESGTALKGPRTPPTENGEETNSFSNLRSEGSPNPAPSAPEKPPVRPPRKKDRLRKPALPLPRRNQSAVSLPRQAAPEATASDLDIYLKRCHSMGTVPALLEELRAGNHASSMSSFTSSLESRHEEVQIPVKISQDRLPSFASVTPPPSPSSTPPGDENVFTHAPHFFIGSRGRSPSSLSSAQETPSPNNLYVDMWTRGKGRGPLIQRDEDGMQDLIRKLRRVRSHGEPERPKAHPHPHGVGDSGVEPLAEHVIDILPTKCAGPPKITMSRFPSSPHLASAPSGVSEVDRNNPRTILLKILGEYHSLPGSGALARAGKKAEEEELRALEKQLDATWAHLRRSLPKMEGKGEGKGEKEAKKKMEARDDDDDDSSSSVTPSLGELEEALAHMLDEDDWEEREEERALRAAKERAREDAEERAVRVAEEITRGEERPVREERLKEEGESGGSVMALRMKRENTFTALSALSKDE